MYYGDLVVNVTYTYPNGNIEVASKIGNGDWFDCKYCWELLGNDCLNIPFSLTDFKLGILLL